MLMTPQSILLTQVDEVLTEDLAWPWMAGILDCSEWIELTEDSIHEDVQEVQRNRI